jgi:predicted secreted Zn-dependent protease
MRDDNVTVTSQSYPVVGTTREAVLRSIDRNGPHKDGERYVAYTTWDVSWSYNLRKGRGDLVSVVDPEVKVGGHVILPEWRSAADAPPDFRAKLARSLRKIEMHESEHLGLAIMAGERALSTLRKLKKPQRGLTRERVDALVGAAIAVIQKKEKDHDKETQNGLKQGTGI